MELTEVLGAVGNTSALVIMAGLFVWTYLQEKKKNTELLKEIRDAVTALGTSNDNFAKSLEILIQNYSNLDDKIDRNYAAILKNGEK